MSMVCERGGEGKRRILIGQSVPPIPFGMAFGRLKLSPHSSVHLQTNGDSSVGKGKEEKFNNVTK
jgi:hypothetical protein